MSKIRKENPPVQLALRSIKFMDDYRSFNKNDEFIFKPGLNVLVGDQGCGKSTLLHCMMDDQEPMWKADLDQVEYLYLDTEKHNPRIQSSLEANIGAIIGSRFMSHGETLLPMILASESAKGYIIFIDEPEASLSIRSQIRVAKALQTIMQYNQVFVCTHSPIIMDLADEVLDLETKKWMSPKDFVISQRSEPVKSKTKKTAKSK